MENLIIHTANLVARYNCVILPGLGAFLAHNVPARYNAEDGVFMPPHRTLGFNPLVVADDALLQTEYMNLGKYSFDEAGVAMAKDISVLRERLAAEGTLRFGELGTFSMNINGEVSFLPGENGIDDPAHFGLDPLVMPLLAKCEEKVIVIPRRSLSRYIAIAAAVILAFFVVTPMSDSAYKPSMQAGFSTTNVKAKSIAPNDVCEIAPVADTATENIITAEPATQEPVAGAVNIEPVEVETETLQPAVVENAVKTTEAQCEKYYHIIVASSPNADNAQLAIKELSAKMEAEYSVVQCGKRHRISIGCYNSNSEANEALSQIKTTFPDAWVLTL